MIINPDDGNFTAVIISKRLDAAIPTLRRLEKIFMFELKLELIQLPA